MSCLVSILKKILFVWVQEPYESSQYACAALFWGYQVFRIFHVLDTRTEITIALAKVAYIAAAKNICVHKRISSIQIFRVICLVNLLRNLYQLFFNTKKILVAAVFLFLRIKIPPFNSEWRKLKLQMGTTNQTAIHMIFSSFRYAVTCSISSRDNISIL